MSVCLAEKIAAVLGQPESTLLAQEGHVKVIERSNVLVIGCGDIGMTFGRKMNALGCRVSGIRRRVPKKSDCPEWMEGMYGMDSLEELLPKADIVAMSLPGNASTYHVLSRERIALLSENAVVLNVGRGTAIDNGAPCGCAVCGKNRGGRAGRHRSGAASRQTISSGMRRIS